MPTIAPAVPWHPPAAAAAQTPGAAAPAPGTTTQAPGAAAQATDTTTQARHPAAGWIAVAPGAEHTCGIRKGGTLWCWGRFQWLGVPTLPAMLRHVVTGPIGP